MQPGFALLAHVEALLRWLPLGGLPGTITPERHSEYKRRWAEVYGAGEGEQP